jgi:hypothetical protein
MKIFHSLIKRTGLVIFSGICLSINTNAQPWAIVGLQGFTPGNAYYTSMGIDRKNIPYVAFQDAANSYAITAMTYNGSAWIFMGSPGLSPANGTSPSLALSSTDTAYIAYVDGTNGSKVSVKKFNGTNWIYEGIPDFSDSASLVSLALGLNDTVYVALIDIKDSSRVTVMKYNGANWVDIGKPGFSTSSDDVSLAIDMATGTPYVAFTNTRGGGNVNVAGYSGHWKKVGTSNFSAGGAAYLSLAINKSSMPIVAYQDGANLNEASVMEYNGSNWVNMGVAGFSKGAAYYTSLALDSAGTPFVAYQDAGNGSAATIAEYNGSTWSSVGSPGCTDGTADYTSLAIDRHGRLYTAYEDGAESGYATVITYQHCNTGNPTVSVSVKGSDTICPGTAANLSVSGAKTYAWSSGDSTSNSIPILTDTNTVYDIYVTGIDTNGCASTDSVKVYTRPAPHVTISGPDSICNGSSAILDARGAISYIWSTGSTSTSISVTPITDTVLSVSGKDAKGCADTVKKKLTLIYGPDITITATEDTVCKCDTTTLTASGGTSYAWSFGSTNASIIVAPCSQTTYTTIVTGSNGCKSNDSITVYIDTACNLGINEISFIPQFKLAPNPSNGIIYLTCNVNLSYIQVKVYNLLGEIIKGFTINNLAKDSPYDMDISSFTAGMYYIRIITAQGALAYKIIKE